MSMAIENEDSVQQGRKTRMEEPCMPKTEDSKKGRKKRKRWNIWKHYEEGDVSDWWFASTAIPLLAATFGPLANVTSIAALVTSWRQTNYLDGAFVTDFEGVLFADPRWCYWINVVSLICGFLGNVFLLFNFTQRIRYIIALPATIIFWYVSSGLLIAITICMQVYAPPNRPYETYTQGFWYAVASATFYTICSMLLMVNMLGHFLGHYPDTFALTDSQRTLILQTMGFFIWLAGGAAVYTELEKGSGSGWSFADALYFCDVTILTVGFGDLAPSTTISRGIIFPYSVGGIITLGLLVSALYRFMRDISEENIVQKRFKRERERALERTTARTFDITYSEQEVHGIFHRRVHAIPRISAPAGLRPFRTLIDDTTRHAPALSMSNSSRANQKAKAELLKEEKDRFEAMRAIQAKTKKFKQWMALFWSLILFSILWCGGAAVFWQTEKDTQDMTYFQALYFCYISLLTIGYGDLSPKSNAGRCFFVVWSLVAIPTMTILVSDLEDTVVARFKKRVDGVADFTILPRQGIWRAFLDKHPLLLGRLQRWIDNRAAKKRIKRGFETTDPNVENGTVASNADDDDPEATAELGRITAPTMPTLAAEAEADAVKKPTHASLSRQLAQGIKKVSSDLRLPKPKRYSYEEWVEFTRLIRLTTPKRLNQDVGTTIPESNDEEGLVDWDWIGEESPMMSGLSESEWLLDRLCESLIRLQKRKEMASDKLDMVAMRNLEMREPVEGGAAPSVDEQKHLAQLG